MATASVSVPAKVPVEFDMDALARSAAGATGTVEIDPVGSMPAGLVFATAAKWLSGMVSTPGTYTAKFDVYWGSSYDVLTVTVTVDESVEIPEGVTAVIPEDAAYVKVDMSAAVKATMTKADRNFAFDSGEIPGITVTLFTLAGTPTGPGQFQLKWTGANAVNEKFSTQWSFMVPGAVDPDPDPGLPEGILAEIAGKVAVLLDVDPIKAAAAAEQVLMFVKAYTRGRGFTDGIPADDVRAVVTSATTRHVNNPALLRSFSVADYSEVGGGLEGFTIPELAVLHQYRRRTC